MLKVQNSASLNFLKSKMEIEENDLVRDLKILERLKLVREENNRYYFHGEKYYNFFEHIIKNYPVENVMSMPVVMEETSSIYDAVVALFLKNVGSIYVSSEGFLSGVVSRKDIIRSTIGDMDLSQTPISLIMTRMPNVVYANPKESIFDCAKKLVDYQVDSIPIVEEIDDKYRVIGRFTKTNTTSIFVRLGENKNIEGMI